MLYDVVPRHQQKRTTEKKYVILSHLQPLETITHMRFMKNCLKHDLLWKSLYI